MPRADRSIPILTGLIIAALYVILLIGFSRESYMRRDAAARVNGAGSSLAVEDVAKRICRVERTASAALSPDLSERPSCITPLDAIWPTRRTPPRIASSIAFAFGNMPSTMRCSSRSRFRPFRSVYEMIELGSSTRSRMPGAPVHNMSFSADSAAPMAKSTQGWRSGVDRKLPVTNGK